MTVGHFPFINECKVILSKVQPPKKVTTLFTGDFRSLIRKPPFDADFLDSVSHGVVPDSIRSYVISSIKDGYRSRYRGGNYFQRDFSRHLSHDDEAKALEKMMKEVERGFCLGPFNSCPFPNMWCDAQAIICFQFFRPKHRFIQDGKYRLICHRSFPLERSFNDLVDRFDSKTLIPDYEYFSLTAFINLLAELGTGTLISLFDVMDAYKQCAMHPDDLWQQVYKLGDKFFIDLGGMFGSKNAGDAWNLTMELIMSSASHSLGLSFLHYFVDNGVNLTPPKAGSPDTPRATSEFKNITNFLRRAKVPIHDIEEPTTKAKFLGWIFDTASMTVSILPERRQWIDSLLSCDDFSKPHLRSIVGVFEFLASVVSAFKAPMGWLRHRVTAIESGSENPDEDFKARFRSYVMYMRKLLQRWDGGFPILRPIKGNPSKIIFVDASGDIGCGAVEVHNKVYLMKMWEKGELLSATRKANVSSAHLELLNIALSVITIGSRGDSIQVYSDSMAAICIAKKKYCPIGPTQDILICLDKFCIDVGVTTEFIHIPREDKWIKICDSLSRNVVRPQYQSSYLIHRHPSRWRTLVGSV